MIIKNHDNNSERDSRAENHQRFFVFRKKTYSAHTYTNTLQAVHRSSLSMQGVDPPFSTVFCVHERMNSTDSGAPK